MNNSSNKSNVLNTMAIIVFLIGSFFINLFLSSAVFLMDYSHTTKKLLILFCISFVVLGVFQIITKKIRLYNLKGRIWGVAFLITAAFMFMPIALNSLNNALLIGLNNDYIEAKDFKYQIIESNNVDDIMEKLDEVISTYKLTLFNEATSELEKTIIDNLTFYYDNEASKNSIESAINALKEFYPIIEKTFKKQNSLNTDIIILNDFNTIDHVNSWVLGFLDPLTEKVYLLNESTIKARSTFASYMNESHSSFDSVVVHEYTHKIINAVINENNIRILNIPNWFSEGVATYYEHIYSKTNIANSSSNIGDLRVDENFDKNNAIEYYERAAIVINYLVTNYEEIVLLDIIEGMSNDIDIYESIIKVTGESFEEIISKVLL